LFGAWIQIGRFRITGRNKETVSQKLAHIGGFDGIFYQLLRTASSQVPRWENLWLGALI
jgi:hypothetical protein